ncbi:MAG TPA: bifunctional enoyl-CoA hydratase/phosphate acetyltransferase [Casimicrobiaceae bacterium]|nr:bifunctional enoyl-CoA hydratase/phosphate acetyltransferase [Casimicrobiaceae bacterium]
MVVRPHFQRLVERARMRAAVPAGFVFPCDSDWLQLALSAAFAGFLEPLLIGPEARIRDAAAHAGLDISRIPIVNTPDSTRDATTCAVELARTGAVKALVRGSLANEDLLAPIVASASGLRSERRLSHAHFLDLPGRAHGLLLTDAVLNIVPTLGAKKDIVQNAIDLAAAVGIGEPRVAILAGIGSVNHAFASTLDADALKMMSSQGLFPGALVDGPMTPDCALSPEIAKAHGLTVEVAGHADILVAPGMESAVLLLRTMTALTGGFAAGVVLGAHLPIVLPTRMESMEVRMASCVLAMLYATRTTAQPGSAKPAPLLRGKGTDADQLAAS